jgi:uncharacterized protein YggE
MSTRQPLAIMSPFTVLAATLAFLTLPAFAQNDQRPGFWVTTSAQVDVKPDEAILIMAIRSSAPASVDALSDSDRKMQAVAQVLDATGLEGKYRFSDNHFGTVRATFQPQPQFEQPSTLMQTVRYIFVTFDGTEIADPGFEHKVAGIMDQLMKSGATQADMQPQGIGTSANSIIYTIKNPEPSFLEASRQAGQRAKATAEETARGLGVTTRGIIDVRVNRPFAQPPVRGPNVLNPLDELHLEYYSPSKDSLVIQATITAEYAIAQ